MHGLLAGLGLGLLAAFVESVPVGGVLLVEPVVGVFVAACVVAGVAGLLGVALGHAAVTLLAGGAPVVLVVSLLAYGTTAVIATVLWHGLGVTERGPVDPLRSRAGRALVALAAGAVAGGVVMAWLYVIFDARPFYLAPRFVAGLFLAAVLVAPALVYVLRRFDPDQGPNLSDFVVPRRFRDVDASPALVLIPFVWGVLGVAGSVAYRALSLVATEVPEALETRGLEFLLVLHDDALYGTGGRRVQSAFGGAMVALLAIATVRAIHDDARSDAEENPAGLADDPTGSEDGRSAVDPVDGSDPGLAEIDRPDGDEGVDA